MSLPISVNTLIQESLVDTINILYPISPQLHSIVKQHRWYTRSDVGIYNGKVVTWSGWSVDLKHVDPQYRTVYCDFVHNVLPLQSRITLFGDEFAQSINDLESFVVMFNTGYTKQSVDVIKSSGFTPRALGNIFHATKVIDPKVFVTMPSMYWAGFVIKLIRLKWQTSSQNSKAIIDDQTDDIFDDLDMFDL